MHNGLNRFFFSFIQRFILPSLLWSPLYSLHTVYSLLFNLVSYNEFIINIIIIYKYKGIDETHLLYTFLFRIYLQFTPCTGIVIFVSCFFIPLCCFVFIYAMQLKSKKYINERVK